MNIAAHDIRRHLDLCLKCHRNRQDTFYTSFYPKAQLQFDYVEWGNGDQNAIPSEFGCAKISFWNETAPEIRQFLAGLWPNKNLTHSPGLREHCEDLIVDALAKTYRSYCLHCLFEIKDEKCPYLLEHVILHEDENRHAGIADGCLRH